MHLIVHWLDVFRHDNAFTWAWYTWIGNVSAGIIIFAVTALFWPRLRHALERFIRKHIHSENAELKARLDHIIKHHPDIPPLGYDEPVSDESTTGPTAAQLEAANLVAVTTWQEIDAAVLDGRGPPRTWDEATQKFPPFTKAYVTKPKPPPVIDYTVTFDSQGGSSVASETVSAKTAINAPLAPTRQGFTFDGWFLSPTNTMEVVEFPYAPDGNVTLYAAWVAVVAPPIGTFTAAQVGAGEVEVTWDGFSPVLIGRNGVDTSGFANWNTGPLTDEPTSGTFTFDFLVPGDTYTFTATDASGATITATCAVTAPSAPKLPTLGMNGGGLTWGGNAASNEAAFALMKELGATLVRIAIPWNYSTDPSWVGFYESDGKTFNAALIEQFTSTVTLAEQYGLTILWLIDGLISVNEPAAGAFCYTPGLPYTPAAYAAAVAWFAENVKGQHIEEVNEPNGFGQSWKGPVALPGSTYALALEATWNAAKAADPTCKLHIGPVSDIQTTAEGGTGVAWRQAVAAALPNWADFIDYDGLHTYTYPTNLSPGSVAGWEEAFVAEFVTKPWWKTEFGYPSNTANSDDGSPEMTTALQSQYLIIEIQGDVSLPTPPEAIFVYCLNDYANKGQVGGDGWWGIVDSEQSEGDTNVKPAFTAIQALYA